MILWSLVLATLKGWVLGRSEACSFCLLCQSMSTSASFKPGLQTALGPCKLQVVQRLGAQVRIASIQLKLFIRIFHLITRVLYILSERNNSCFSGGKYMVLCCEANCETFHINISSSLHGIAVRNTHGSRRISLLGLTFATSLLTRLVMVTLLDEGGRMWSFLANLALLLLSCFVLAGLGLLIAGTLSITCNKTHAHGLPFPITALSWPRTSISANDEVDVRTVLGLLKALDSW